METLGLEVYQFAPRLADPGANLEKIADRAARSRADVLLTPELSVTGYDLGDEAADLAVPLMLGAPVGAHFSGIRTNVLLGLCERGEDGITYNAMVAVQDGLVRFRHRKLYLPTYGMFDEGRFFGRGNVIAPWSLGSWRIGVLLCEDLWHPGLAYVLACSGIQVLLVAAAAPGRGIAAAETASAGSHSRFATAANWETIVRSYALLFGIYVALANRTGVEGSSTFAGGSLIAGPDGGILTRAPDSGEAVLHADLDLAAVRRARRPYAHIRDEDLPLMIRSLSRLAAQ
jgi:predicted amidohydrolase